MALRMRVDPQTTYVVKRFLVKVLLLSIAACFQRATPWGLKGAATALALFAAAIAIGFAAAWRERPFTDGLNYWDEAIAFCGIAIAAQTFL